MRKNKLLLLLALLMTAATGAWAQTEITTIPNGDFETWTYDGEDMPNYWNSNATSDGSLAAMSGGKQLKRSTDVRPGSSGQYSCSIWSKSTMGVINIGILTSGRIHFGSMSSANNANYIYSDRDGSNTKNNFTNPCAMPFTGKPTAIKVWVKYVQGGTGYGNYATAKFSATIHGDADYVAYNLAEHDNDDNKALVVASAEQEIAYNNGEWEQLTIPFNYTDNDVAPAYILINAYTNAYPGKGKANDYLYIDDIELEYAAAASSTYTVSLKDGVKDADKWTVKVGEGQAQALPIGGLKGDGSETVTLQYNGRLKVKGVTATSDAPAAKPAATVTTAPTGAAIVGVGKTTALVSGGAAEGGTLMYAVTTTNTKPASTDGFSATVPTAQTITASGTVYVWYYVKGDDTHSDSEIAATAIEVPVADIVWDITNISSLAVAGTGDSYEKEGIKLSANAEEVYATWINDGISFSAYQSGGFTFTAPTGKAFTKIEMKALDSDGWATANLGTGWAFNNPTVTWKGSAAASTVGLLTGADNYYSAPVTYIAFYLSEQAAKPAATVTTAPTGAAIVGVGKTTALVSGGVAEGGTLMYAVTTTNTKPASTDGFSGAVPTAQTITASGTVYVWYYVKGDDSHSDSEIAATAIEVPVADIVWDITNVTDIDVEGTYASYTKEGITLSANDGEDIYAMWNDNGDPTTDGISFQVYALGGFTFTAPAGKEFTKIEMNAVGDSGWYNANLGVGWTYFEDVTKNIYKVTWTGSAASTDKLLPLTEDFIGENVTSIGFYLVDAE